MTVFPVDEEIEAVILVRNLYNMSKTILESDKINTENDFGLTLLQLNTIIESAFSS